MKKQKEWRTHDGILVPDGAISPFDKRKEPKVHSMFKKLAELRDKQIHVDRYIMETADMLIKDYYKSNGKEWDNRESYTLYSYDKSIKIESRKNSVLQLGDEVNLAYSAFNEYLDDVLSGKNADIRSLVTRAFSTSKGEMDAKRLIGLLGIQIQHPKWHNACELLRKAITTNSTKRFIKISLKNKEGEYEYV